MNVDRQLRILLLEDVPSDAELAERALRKAGLVFIVKRTDNRNGFVEALKEFAPDIVLCDYNLIDFDGLSALKIVREGWPDLPVVMLTGALGDEAAAGLIKAGANDFILKDRLARLPSAIKGALDEAAAIRARVNAERDAAEETAKFRGLVEQNIAGVFAIEKDGKIGYINSGFASLCGYSYSKVIGVPFLEFVVESDRVAVADRIASQFAESRIGEQIELRLKHRDGTVIDVLAHGNLATFQARPVIIGFAIDVTKRKKAEAALRESDATYRLLFDSMLNGFAHCRMLFENGEPRDFTYLKVNHAFESLTGLKDVVGRNVTEVISNFREADPTLFEKYCRVATTGQPAQFETYVESMQMWFSVSVYCPKLEEFVVVFDVITERKRSETLLREQEAKYRGLVEQEISGIVILRQNGVFAYVNPQFAKMVGATPDELIGCPLLDFVPPVEQYKIAEAIHRQMEGELNFVQLASSLTTRDGATLDILVNASRSEYQGHPASTAVVLDITDRRRAERSLERMNGTLRTLSSGNEALVRATNEQRLLDEMCRTIVEVGGYRAACIRFAEHDNAKTLRPMAFAGAGKSYLESATVTWADVDRGQGTTETAIRTGETQINQDYTTKPNMSHGRTGALDIGLSSNMALPLKDTSGVFGALTIYAADTNAFASDEIQMLTELANDISYGIAALRDREGREEAERQLLGSMKATIGALSNTVEARDPYTAGHQQRVATLAQAIAREMGLSEMQCDGVQIAGVVHDIGKIAVPAEFLAKPGRLTKTEFGVVQGHVIAGYEILKDVTFPWPIAQIVLQHHERLDGGGYPNGLKGDDILLEAKILAVADVTEAMMSHRPYRPGLGLEAALAEIDKGKGRLFDTVAVETCTRLFREKQFRLT